MKKIPLLAGVLAVSACVANAAQQGRYIVYLDATTSPQMQGASGQATLVNTWSKTLDGEIQIERQLGTGGWVIIVTSDHPSPDDQLQKVRDLPGIESVDRDAMMRHQ